MLQQQKFSLYDKMVKKMWNFCSIYPISRAYTKQKNGDLQNQELKWVMIKQNE